MGRKEKERKFFEKLSNRTLAERIYDNFVPGSFIGRVEEFLEVLEANKSPSSRLKIYALATSAEVVRLGAYGVICFSGSRAYNNILELISR